MPSCPGRRLLSAPTVIQLKEIYEEPSRTDGYRVLVDRLWPRGLTKDRARIDEWAKGIAPSSKLSGWIHADRSVRSECMRRRVAELREDQD